MNSTRPPITSPGLRILATGLNRWDHVRGAWVPAEARFEMLADGTVVARHTAHQVILAANLNSPAAVDLDYHPGNQSLIVSANFDNGQPVNFRRVAPSAVVSGWSLASGFEFEIPLTTSQATIGLFTVGEAYFGESPSPDHPARLWRMSPSGVLDPSYWVELEEPDSDPLKREDAYKPQSICLDPTGVFGNDMLVATGWLEQNSGGNVWRVNRSNKSVTLLAELGECLEGLLVCPNDIPKYGPDLAGKLLVRAGTQWRIHLVDPQGGHTSMALGMPVFDMHLVPVGQPLYCLDFRFKPGTLGWSSYFIGSSRLLKVGSDFFTNIPGDILLISSGEAPVVDHLPNGALFLLHWTGSRYVTLQVSDDLPRIIEHAVFAPVSLP